MNARQRLFVSEYLIDHNSKQAAIRAGYSERNSGSIANKVLKKPHIIAAIEEGLKNKMERNKITADDLVHELEENRQLALECKAPGPAVSATMGKAKLLGLIIDKAEHTGVDGGPLESKIQIELVRSETSDT